MLSACQLVGVGLVLLLAGVGCDSPSRKLSGTDCKPRKLAKMQACVGEDHGLQECRFFFSATGVPEKSWCEALAAQAQAQADGAGAGGRCDWGDAAAWRRVACATYAIHGAARCFACSDSQPEAAKTYVYGYDATCTHGVEQVTCNVDAAQAGMKRGRANF